MDIHTFLQQLEHKHQHEKEFLQSAKFLVQSVIKDYQEWPEYVQTNVLQRLLEPDRVFVFKVVWKDDHKKVHVNLGFRIQYNNALGVYKGGMRFHAGANLSVLKFLAFEQSLKNALTGMALGGAMGGSDFDPKGKSEDEIMSFCHYYMIELHKYIGPDIDVPGNDMGVGTREIGYLYGMYKKLKDKHNGSLSGKSTNWGGVNLRLEAPGYGIMYFLQEVLRRQNIVLKEKRIVVSGFGKVAWGVIKKANQLGVKVVAVSGPDGYVYDEEGISEDKADFLLELSSFGEDLVKPYTYRYPETQFHPGKKPWEVKADIGIPCAIQNEIDEAEAMQISEAGYSFIVEGANMPCTNTAIEIFKASKIGFIPGKAANAGGVVLSGLEMSQNALKMNMSEAKIDESIQDKMKQIHESCLTFTEPESENIDYFEAANKAAFHRLARAIIDQGLV